MKKALRETQTLCAGRSNAETKFFCPAADPFPGAQLGRNLISWRWPLPSPADPVWWKLMHTISSYRGNRPTHTHARPPVAHTQTGPITIHCAAKLSVQCNENIYMQTTNKQTISISVIQKKKINIVTWSATQTAIMSWNQVTGKFCK